MILLTLIKAPKDQVSCPGFKAQFVLIVFTGNQIMQAYGLKLQEELERTWPRARLWSRRVRQVMFSGGIDGAFSFRISAFVLAGLATTSTCTSIPISFHLVQTQC